MLSNIDRPRPDPVDRQCLRRKGYQSKSKSTYTPHPPHDINPYMITVPNNLHRRSHPSASTAACPVKPFPLSPRSNASTPPVLVLLFTPYSFRQQTNGFAPGGGVASSPFTSALRSRAAERWPRFASRGCSAVASAALRSSRSPQRMKSFSRRVARAVGFARRLCGRFG